MKAKTIIIGFITASFSAMAFLTVLPIPTLESLTQGSPDIIIAQCTKTPDPYNLKTTNGISIDPDGLIDSDIEVISILKGATNFSAVRLTSQYWPRQGEYYLIFSNYHDSFYQALESYRIVPLGINFNTNPLSGKTLDEQIQMLLQRRLNDLNRQVKDEQEERQRLEKAVKH